MSGFSAFSTRSLTRNSLPGLSGEVVTSMSLAIRMRIYSMLSLEYH